MLVRMLRTSLAIAAFLCLPAVAAPPVLDVAAVVAAKEPTKKGGGGKKETKPESKPIERPSDRPADPRMGAAAAAEGGMTSEVRRGMARIEFDDRLIKGQTNKANAIYLFERRESALRSLLKKRAHFHDEIDETLE
jgi:hypothetical protein